MSSMKAFHDTVKRIQPTEKVSPVTFWVGVLPVDKVPSNVIQHTDLLWIKARGKISAGRIRTAFCSSNGLDPNEILLKFENRLLLDSERLCNLNLYLDKIVAIEAVKTSDRSLRFPMDIKPLQNTPKQPTSFTPSSLTEQKSRLSPSRFSVGTRSPSLTDISPKPDNRSSLSTPNSHSAGNRQHTSTTTVKPRMTRAAPPLWHPDMEDATLMAFTDLSCQHRALHKRSGSSVPLEMQESKIRSEWQEVCQTESYRTYFRTRSSKILSKAVRIAGLHPASLLVFNFIGFWTFYYARRDQACSRGSNPEQDDEFQNEFFNNVLEDWGRAPNDTRLMYMAPHKSDVQIHPIILPDVGQVGIKPDPLVQLDGACDEPRYPSVAPEHPTSVPSVDAPPAFNCQELFTDCTTEQLEGGVRIGLELLDKLQNILSAQNQTSDTTQWLQNIQNVARQAQPMKTIVGVVGNTGAGKSSVINALLDEERLVPTNCMRACTAVVTEISWNEEEIPYRANIEFISADSWRDELKVLFQDLLDGNGAISHEVYNEDSEAAIAYAKIRAVYPKLTKDEISKSSVDELLAHGNVSRLLGSSKLLSDTDPLSFYKDLQKFVDSKEKSTGPLGKDKEKEKRLREMEYWPLIRVVRLYVKAEALRSGVVLCDLPGVHDSNQARAAVAENYLKQCTGLWIVAPITRAVDDKAAKSLLGESFKRQLKMDGGFSTVTFICSKTDDISITEAQDSLGIEEEMGELWHQVDNLDRSKKNLQKELEELKETKTDYMAAIENAEDEKDVWEQLLDDLSEGLTVYAPKPQSGSKRRRRSGSESPHKRQKFGQGGLDTDFIDEDDSNPDSEPIDIDTEDRGDPLTKDEIQTKIMEIKALRKDGRQEKAKLDEAIREIRSKLSEVQTEKAKVDAEMSAICISGRNEYSKSAIQQDFASGIKELDQELAEEIDAANFNPDVDARDYEEVARSLPVFCVSSRAYQKLQGRLVKDSRVPGFNNVDETEIPQLQAHCQKLTEAGREATCRRFFNGLNQLLNSLRFWSSNDGTGRNLSRHERAQEAHILEGFFRRLDANISKAVKSVCNAVLEELQDHIFDQFHPAIVKAIDAALPTVDSWGAPVNRDNRAAGGFCWSTYKAICRRDGVYNNAQGLHDFNAQLTDPILRVCAPGWERCFSRRLPGIMSNLPTDVDDALKIFHSSVEDRMRRNGGSIASLHMLKNQLDTYKESFKEITISAREDIITRQKDINREFVPVVAKAMGMAYHGCTSESGPGSFMRMKALMSRHVEHEKTVMFQDSTKSVKDQLQNMVSAVEVDMLAKADIVFMAVKRDYTAAVVGQDVTMVSQVPRGERLLRSEVLDIVDSAEHVFKRSLGIDVKAGEYIDGMSEDDNQSTATDGTESTASPVPRSDVETHREVAKPSDQASSPIRSGRPMSHGKDDDGPFEIHEDTSASRNTPVIPDNKENDDVNSLRKTRSPSHLTEAGSNLNSSSTANDDMTVKKSESTNKGYDENNRMGMKMEH